MSVENRVRSLLSHRAVTFEEREMARHITGILIDERYDAQAIPTRVVLSLVELAQTLDRIEVKLNTSP